MPLLEYRYQEDAPTKTGGENGYRYSLCIHSLFENCPKISQILTRSLFVKDKRSKNFDKRPNHCQKSLHWSQDRGKAVDNALSRTWLCAEFFGHNAAFYQNSKVSSLTFRIWHEFLWPWPLTMTLTLMSDPDLQSRDLDLHRWPSCQYCDLYLWPWP